MEETLRKLQNELSVDLTYSEEEYHTELFNTAELRYGFRRGWQECEVVVTTCLKALFDTLDIPDINSKGFSDRLFALLDAFGYESKV